jgi:hypothetical protein
VDLLDMKEFMTDGIIVESAFFKKVEEFDWERFRDRRVLVKGCGTTIIPPWAFMAITARLAPIARRIRYGNEHSSVPVYTRLRRENVDVE